jgi:homocysteine S-methyltransferase
MNAISERVKTGRVLILDGAIGTEFQRRGVDVDEMTWVGSGVLEHRPMLETIHEDYIHAGADVISTNTYSTTRFVLDAIGRGDETRKFNMAAIDAAKTARDRARPQHDVWIAGVISPMAPAMDPGRRPSPKEAEASFREVAEIHAEGGVDIILIEMVRDVEYGTALLNAAKSTGLPVWASFTCARAPDGRYVSRPGGTGSGSQNLFEEVLPVVIEQGGLSLVASMHTDMPETPGALDIIKRFWKGPIGAYPNIGGIDGPGWAFDQAVTPADYLAAAKIWLASGATLIGGCCGVTPDHIRVVAENLKGVEIPR